MLCGAITKKSSLSSWSKPLATLPQIAEEQTPRMTYRTKRKFEMRETSFPKDVDEAIKAWLYEQIKARRRQLENRHKKLVPEWRRIAEGRPKEEKKSWPFENCANLVHQIVGEAADDMAARVMQIVWATAPIAIYRYFTKSTDPQEAEKNAKKSKILEQAMDYFAYEPNELDLWNRENIWFSESTKLGTAWVCSVPEERVEQVYIGYDKQNHGSNFEEATLYEGPRVLNLRDEDVLYDPDVDTPEESDFLSRKVTLTRRKLQEREFKGLYKKGSVALILGKPDRYGPDENRRKDQKGKGAGDAGEDKVLAEWDVEECYFYWYHNKKKFRLIAWFHYETKTVMNQVFNFIPENQIPLIRTRLSSGEKGMNGTGYAAMLKYAQEEISTAKNQRTDSITWGMLGLNRMSPQNKNIDRNMKIYPGAGLPFAKDEFEHFDVGNPAMASLSMENEAAMIQQARERAGVGPAVAGQGAGSMMGRGRNAQFGSMGTLAVMQDSNTRVAHRTSDFRHAHVKLFGLLTDMYGAMGLGRKGSLFGLDDKLLTEALSDYLERRVKIPIRAATASANKEVTKQNELLLNSAMMMYVKEASTMMQAIENAGAPPFYKKWLTSVVKSRTRLMQQIVRDFQLSDQPEEFIPDVEFPQEQQVQGAPRNGQAPTGVDPRIIEMANQFRKPGGSPVPGAAPGVGEPPNGPPGGTPTPKF
jgi:hypothetical protein